MRFSRLPNWPWRGRRTIAGTLAAMVLGFILPAWLGVAFLIVSMYAAQRERPVQGGAGLGLSIAREIVQRLGGKIGFVDAPGGGAIFHVVLPVVESVAEIASDVRDGARAERERARLARLKSAAT